MKRHLNIYTLTLIQITAILLIMWLLRLVFAIYNADLTGNPGFGEILRLSLYGIRFDLCACAWVNSLFIAMRFLPFPFAARRVFVKAGSIVYFVTNSLMLAVMTGDIPFYRFSGSHMRIDALLDIFKDPEAGNIMFSYTGDFWWAYLSVAVLIAVVALLAFRLRSDGRPVSFGSGGRSVAVRIALFILAAGLTFLCIRGRVGPGRPLSIGDAAWGVESPQHTEIVLNTPFTLIRSSKAGARIPEMRFFSDSRLAEIRSSEHPALPDSLFNRRNIVVITMESGSALWVPYLSPAGGEIPEAHLTPFLDSLARVSLVSRSAYATGIRTIEGVNAVYGGFPSFGEMIYMSSPYMGQPVDAPARLLRDKGYATRFYFGGSHGSYSIDQFVKLMGFSDVMDRDTYADESEFDGTWGIFDHAMGRYAALDMSRLPQPFFAGWLTLDTHEPFATPDHWHSDGYANPKGSLLRSVEYADRSLRRFFETARTQPWYRNTIFIITGDHGTRDLRGTDYDTPWIQPHILFMVYTPDGSIAPGEIPGAMTQFDIAPTLLSLVGYPDSHVSLGRDVLSQSGYALSYLRGLYQVYGERYMVQLSPDMKHITAVYDHRADPLARKPLPAGSYDADETDSMADWARAFMQDYTVRLNSGKLVTKDN